MRDREADITPAPAWRSRRAGGFTMVELLVVMGIIAVLGTIAVVGMRAMAGQQQRNQTRMMLTNAASILAEYDAKTQLKRQPRHWWEGPPIAPEPDRPLDVWRDADASTQGPGEQEGLEAPVGDLTEPGAGQPREEAAGVRNAQVVLWMASQVPAAKSMIAGIPPDQTMRLRADIAGTPMDERTEPILLDGWNNPIMFVPASGLREVTLADQTGFVVTSVKVYPETELPDGTLAPNARPFFASAGPDGSFVKGDDNLYSFEK